MELDSDTKEVYDVYLEFLKSDTFPDILNSDTTDLVQANKFATSQSPEGNELVWQDVRADQESKIEVIKVKEEDSLDIQFEIGCLCEETDQAFHKNARETGKYDRREIADMYEFALEDFQLIMLARALQGRTNIFYEKLFEVYKKGGWPCYWEGPIPEGRPIVYSNTE